VLLARLDCHKVVRLLVFGEVIIELFQTKRLPDNGAWLLINLGARKVLSHMGILGKDIATREKDFVGV